MRRREYIYANNCGDGLVFMTHRLMLFALDIAIELPMISLVYVSEGGANLQSPAPDEALILSLTGSQCFQNILKSEIIGT